MCSSESGLHFMFFADDTTGKINLSEQKEVDGVEKIQKNNFLLQSCKIGTGGYSITFNDTIDIPAHVLYTAGVSISLGLEDFVTFVRMNIMDTGDSCNELENLRQNIFYIQKRQQMMPVKKDVKGNLYLKGEVLANKW